MTVSYTLTGRRPVAAETRRHVLETIDRLGYRVNLAARNLRQGRTGVIGLAVPTLSSSFYGSVGTALRTRFAPFGFRVVVEETGGDREREVQTLRESRISAYDGLVMAAVSVDEAEIRALAGGLPVVVFAEQPAMGIIDHVASGNEQGARLVAEHLLALGCRRFGVIGLPNEGEPPLVNEADAFLPRARSFLARVAEVPGTTAVTSYRGGTFQGGLDAVAQVLARDDGVEGLFCVSDTLALGAVRGLADAGRRVPDDLLVVGFNDIVESRFTVPSLTSVSPGLEEMLDQAATMMVDRLQDPEAPPRSFTSSVRLVQRESTSRRRGRRRR